MTRKVFDCFLFWQEFKALEIRLNELYDVVDQFIIVEFSQSHSGRQKPHHLKENLELFVEFKDKIHLFSLDDWFPNKTKVHIAHKQRKVLDQIIFSNVTNGSDLVITSDSDEIIRNEIIQSYKSSPYSNVDVAIELKMYHNYLNNFMGNWVRPRIKSRFLFRGFSDSYRDIFLSSKYEFRRYKQFPFMRVDEFFSSTRLDKYLGTWVGFEQPSLRIEANGGWHFTKLYPAETNYEHALDTPHTEVASEGVSLEAIRNRIANRETSYGKISQGVKVAIDDSFPIYVSENVERFQGFIL